MQGRNNDDVDDLKRTRPNDRLEDEEQKTGCGLPHEYNPRTTKKHKRDDRHGGPATAATATMTAADSAIIIDRHGHSDNTGRSGLFVTTTAGRPEQQLDGNDDDDDMSTTGATKMVIMDVDDDEEQPEKPTTTTADYCFYLEDRHLPPPPPPARRRTGLSSPSPRGDWAMIRRPSPRQSPPSQRQLVRSAQRQVWDVMRTRSKNEDEPASMM